MPTLIFNNIDEVALSSNNNNIELYITKTSAESYNLNKIIETLQPKTPRYYFPDWETLPYDLYSPSANIIADRLNVLYRVRDIKKGIIISSIDTILSRLCPPSYLDSHALLLKVGDELPLDDLVKRISQAGFINVNQVSERGQFSRRGSLLDLFPPGSKFPIRLDYFDDEVESIRIFDVKTQISAAKIDSVELIPSKEMDLSDSGRVCFRQSMRQLWGDKSENHAIYKKLSKDSIAGGLEYYLPLFFDETFSFFDYIPKETQIHIERGYKTYLKKRMESIQTRYTRVINMGGSEPLKPEIIYFNEQEWLNFLPNKENESLPKTNINKIKIPKETKERKKLLNKILNNNNSVYVFCQSDGQKQLFKDKMKKNIPTLSYTMWGRNSHAIGIGFFPRSYQIITSPKQYLISASEFLTQHIDVDDEINNIVPMSVIDDLSQIEIGTPVVHHEHGVGRYKGLELIDIDNESNEYITIQYADDGKLFIPVTSLDMITRYTGASPENAPLHKLDGKQWNKAKAKAKEKIHDTAAELLEIYAKRASAKGVAIKINEKEIQNFAEGFTFSPTPDQKQTFISVIDDLTKEQPMDRIVCGDVGFGKTEVALRAAFIVASAGKQVAVLVPTTLLSEQHLKNFEDRFAAFPINIAGLSRFKTNKEQKEVLKRVEEGTIDIVIGTHRLIQKDVAFKNLGLIIIDEEHKFGVKQKENIKKIRNNVNILTLTATPIPRTLSMSLSGLRDLSIIASPPAKRTPVETIFINFDDDIISEGVSREIARGGQIYFLNNDIATMSHIQTKLQKLFPKLSIRHAHGQMREKELEKIMLDFHQQHFDILLTTTIVESGIDNPNANTIFINRADKFGLAQLHQLRGRVGRSVHQAYAYLITPGQEIISNDAKKRLTAFGSLKGLGVGFLLASQDMEIRGAGELLGDNQSGQITEIGFSLFNEMLEETIDAMKNNRSIDFDNKHIDIDIDIGVPALIPNNYIYDAHSRLVLYKRIAGCLKENELDKLQIEFIDRFGLLPESVKVLFMIFEIKIIAREVGVNKIISDNKNIVLTLSKNHKIDPNKMINLIQKEPAKYKPQKDSKGQDKIIILNSIEDWQKRGLFIKNFINEII